MSTSLYWEPPPQKRTEDEIYSLKWILAKKFGQYDGSMAENLGMIGKNIIPYLEGIMDCGTQSMAEDAKKLIEAIEKYGEIEIYIK